MYKLSTNNGITKTFGSLAEAQEYCDTRYAEMSWDVFGANGATEWHGEPVDGEDDDHDVVGALIVLRHDDLEAWATKVAETYAANVRSEGGEPNPRDVDTAYEGLEAHERAAIRDALAELRDSENA